MMSEMIDVYEVTWKDNNKILPATLGTKNTRAVLLKNNREEWKLKLEMFWCFEASGFIPLPF